MRLLTAVVYVLLAALGAGPALAAAGSDHRSEIDLVVPDLSQVSFLGTDGHTLLLFGLGICVLGLVFGLVIYGQLKNLPVHRSMLEISELIYETCKTYLVTQGRFILLLELFIGAIMIVYFGVLVAMPAYRVATIVLFSLIGIAGSYSVAWFGIRINTFANSRTAFAALEGKPFPCYAIPLKAGMSIGMLLISIELLLMLIVLLFIPRDLAYPVLHRLRDRRVARCVGAAHRGRHLHQDRRHRVRPDEDRLQHQGGRRAEPRRDRRLHGRQRRRLGRSHGRRLRDLRRHGRGAHLVHPAGRCPA